MMCNHFKISILLFFIACFIDSTHSAAPLKMVILGFERDCVGSSKCGYTGRIYGNIAGDFSKWRGCFGIFLEHCYVRNDCSRYSPNWQSECFFSGNCYSTACRQLSNDDHCYCEDKSNPLRFRFRPGYAESWYRLAAFEINPYNPIPYNISAYFDVSNPPAGVKIIITSELLATTDGELHLQADPIIMCIGLMHALVKSIELLNKDWF
ncbi:uncharacterized protein LOC131932199 [Physella acuta]|uniref:uncharacterized protein LOC131932199 n=1 Tax=Physella acuta TaxID=109671 RepID=UPI0027DE916B|nr:uncharacterized protein LOC131932199 [Physella acuta]XP_059145062.1 uncharacterized protein LOC131932199 [Physella acuta]